MRSISLFFIFLFFTACNSEVTELEFPSEEPPRLTTEALLLDGSPIRIRVGRTNSLGQDRITFRARDAEVLIYQDDTIWRELLLLAESDYFVGAEPRVEALFGTEESVYLREGSRYRLQVSAPEFPDLITVPHAYRGRHLDSQISILRTVKNPSTDECIITNYQIVFKDDFGTDDYYVAEEFSSLDTSRFALEGRLFNNAIYGFDDLANGDTLKLSVGGNRTIRCLSAGNDNLRFVELYVMDQSWKNFVNAIELSYNEIAGLFSNPPPIPHNVTGGYGYFGLGTAYTFPITE